jgi:uncharacterized protein
MSLHGASVLPFAQILRALDGVLAKAAAHAEAKKIAPDVLLGLRHSPDMFSLARQVQVACDFAKNTSGRLAGAELPKYPDDEKTFAELHQRIAKTLTYIEGLPANAFKGAETRRIEFPLQGKPHGMSGTDYLNAFALPNFYFHVTTAYTILRANGLDLSKRDYLGAVIGLKPV